MAKKRTERNRTNPNTNTISQQRARINAGIDGRGQNSAYTGGARTAQPLTNSRGYQLSELQGQQQAWNNGQQIQTVTRTRNGRMSTDGRKAGGSTWTFTNRDMEGNLVSQSGRKTLSNRRQRDYDVRKGMNNISPRVVEAWLRNGMARVVDGRMEGNDGNVIRQNPDGTYSMGLSAG